MSNSIPSSWLVVPALRADPRLKVYLTGDEPASFSVRATWLGPVLASGKGFESRRAAQIAGQEAAAKLGCPDAAYGVQLRAGGWNGA